MNGIEFSSGPGRTCDNALVTLARRTGRFLEDVIELASQDRLGELFDEKGELRMNSWARTTPQEAQRALVRYAAREPLHTIPGDVARARIDALAVPAHVHGASAAARLRWLEAIR